MKGHHRDEDCTLDADLSCTVCGVYHGDPCQVCGGAGFHRDDCPENDEGDPPMTTLGDLLDRVKNGDAKAAIRVSEGLRARGFTYECVRSFVLDRRGVDPRDFEALLLEGESETR